MTDAPEPDVQEQQQLVQPPFEPVPPTIEPEVPEADAIEQALPAPLPDEDERP